MQNKKNDRRGFLKTTLGLAGTGIIGSLFAKTAIGQMTEGSAKGTPIPKAANPAGAKAAPAKAQATPPGASGSTKLVMLDPADPMAKSLGYHHDASKVDPKKFDKRSTAEAKKTQFCTTCQLYKKVEGTGADEKGTCSLFMNPTPRHVFGQGWCNSWVKKA